MAVFTAIATAIVGAIATASTILGSTMLFNLAVGVVATGLAVGTAKLLGVYDAPSVNGSDPGVKVQLPPATDNKVAKLYGRNFTGGIITDAEIKNQNDTMAYAMVISEYAEGETWTVNEIYRGDAKLVFGTDTSPGAELAPWIVVNQIDTNSTSSTNIRGKLRCRVYAGGSTAAHQIFPTTNAADAYANGSDGYCQFKNWTSANTMEGLVFAVFEIDYDAENNLYGLDSITFDLENSVSNPADVLLDYLTNDRYGAQLTLADIDTDSFDDWRTFCSEQVTYLDGQATQRQHDRYRIDGALSTFSTCKQNINLICQNSGTIFTYDGKVGKFGVTPLRAESAENLANAFVLNPDNIVSGITVSGTDLFNLFNAVEVEYPSIIQRDQTDVYYSDIDPSLRNPNEPDNVLNFRLNMVNDRTRVAALANIDLNQSRVSTVIELSADHSALQVDVGDVVKLTDPLYGFDNKLFRVMRTTETEDGEGVLSAKLSMLEYDADVYDDLLTQEDLPPAPNGVDNYYILHADVEPFLGNVYVFPDSDNAEYEVYDPISAGYLGNVAISTISSNVVYSAGAIASEPHIITSVKMPLGSDVRFSKAIVNLRPYDETNTALGGNGNFTFDPPAPQTKFSSDTDFVYLAMPIKGSGSTFLEAPNVNGVAASVTFQDGPGVRSSTSTTGIVDIRSENYIPKEDLAVYAAGFQAVESFPSYIGLSNATVLVDLTTTEVYDLRGVSRGVYPILASGGVTGFLSLDDDPSDTRFRANINVTYQNVNTLSLLSYNTAAGFIETNRPPQAGFPKYTVSGDIVVDPFTQGLPAEWEPYEMDVTLQGYSTLGTDDLTRGFTGLHYEIGKITKAEK